MQSKVNGSLHEITLEGPISEKTEIYDYDLSNASEILINMEKVTFINSIGVKNWITWVLKIPHRCKVRLEKCPFVITNQVNIVQGFLPRNSQIESFNAPYICDSCGQEKYFMLSLGKEYEYATATSPKAVNLPEEVSCSKCGDFMEPDFLVEKTFSFLNPKN